jgi:hypothetical protein
MLVLRLGLDLVLRRAIGLGMGLENGMAVVGGEVGIGGEDLVVVGEVADGGVDIVESETGVVGVMGSGELVVISHR